MTAKETKEMKEREQLPPTSPLINSQRQQNQRREQQKEEGRGSSRHRLQRILQVQQQQQGESQTQQKPSGAGVVNLITSAAPLLPSKGNANDFLEDCFGGAAFDETTNTNIVPEEELAIGDSCSGGISAVVTYLHNFTKIGTEDTDTDTEDQQQLEQEPYVVIQKFDKDSPFVNMHPLGWVVNRLVLREIFNFDVFMSTPSLLLQNSIDTQLSVSNRDISELQTTDLPFLLSNTNVDISHSWFPFVEQIHFSSKTKLATMNIAHNTNVPLAIDPVRTVVGFTRYIHRLNMENGCYDNQNGDGEDNGGAATSTATVSYGQYLDDYPLLEYGDGGTINTTNPSAATSSTESSTTAETCWLTVVLFSDVEPKYWSFLEQIMSSGLSIGNKDSNGIGGSTSYPPNVIINLEPTYVAHERPEKIEWTYGLNSSSNSTNSKNNEAQKMNQSMWVGQCPMSRSAYCQHRIHLSSSSEGVTVPEIKDIEFIYRDLDELPTELKATTRQWNQTITQLRPLAVRAEQNNPVVGYTSGGPMPVSRLTDVDGDYRACNAGECPLGSLFTDAIRWYTGTDIAFTSSGGYRGPGWSEGPVKLTDLYGGLPFPNTECVGTMTGLDMYRLFNYTTAISSFEGADTDTGGRLLQVSGVRVTYNTQLEVNSTNSYSRLVSIEVWNPKVKNYEPLERTKVYTFSSDSYVCGAYDPYPQLTGKLVDGSSSNYKGGASQRIGEDVVQNIVAEYLAQLEEPWDVSMYGGRLVNDTSALRPLEFIQDPDSCPTNHVWIEDVLSCIECPSFENVVFSDDNLSFEADSDTILIGDGRIVLVNREISTVAVSLKSKPSWVEFVSGTVDAIRIDSVDNRPISLTSGNSMALEFVLRPSVVGTGVDRTAVGSVSFGVQDGGSFPGCIGVDATFSINLRVTPPDEYNYLGNFFYVGVAFASVVFLTAFLFTGFVFVYSKSHVVKVMQPSFLVTICVGVAILGSAMIPLGIDDGRVPTEGVDIACMSIPWLISTGFTISFSALFSKLWRINKLFNSTSGLQRIVVRPQDVLRPFVVLFTLNTGLLLSWTLVDPLSWERFEIDGQPWNTYGKCVGETPSTIFVSLIGAINLLALIFTCIQAYLARNISDEFSESKYIGIAVLGWLQTALIGVPILFLIDDGNPTASYFLQVALVFVICMSMMSIIFLPVLFNYKNTRKDNNRFSRVSISGIDLQQGAGENHVTGSIIEGLSNSNSRLSSSQRGSGTSGSMRQSAQAALGRFQLGMLDSINELPSSSAPEQPPRHENENLRIATQRTLEEVHLQKCADDQHHQHRSQKVEQATSHALPRNDRVSGEVERVAIASAEKNRKMLIHNTDLHGATMEEHVNRLMAAMEDQEDDDDDRSSSPSDD